MTGDRSDLNRSARRYVVGGMAGLGNAGARNSRRTSSDEDIVQETLLRAWQHPEAIAGRPARPWLFAVARNLAIDSYRARRARPHEVGEAALEVIPGPDDAERALESWAVADALSALRPEHKRVLLETYYRGKSVAEAASSLGVPAGTVKSRTFYALRALRLALEERGLAP